MCDGEDIHIDAAGVLKSCLLVVVMMHVVMWSNDLCIQVDTLLNEAELCAEITLVKKQLTTRQLESLAMNADTVHGNMLDC